MYLGGLLENEFFNILLVLFYIIFYIHNFEKFFWKSRKLLKAREVTFQIDSSPHTSYLIIAK